MLKDGSFAQVAKDMLAVIDLVRREAQEECPDDRFPVEGCVRDAVAALWDSRIETFVPLLALRRVRGCLRAGAGAGDDW